MTILTDIIFTCGQCKRLFNRNHKGEKIYLDLKPKNITHKEKSTLRGNNFSKKSINIFCSYCKKYYGKFENGEKTYFPPQSKPATQGDSSHEICNQCVATDAFMNYKSKS